MMKAGKQRELLLEDKRERAKFLRNVTINATIFSRHKKGP